MKKLVLCLLVMIAITSCATPFLDRPTWVRSGIKVFGYVVNVGYGEGPTEREAKDKAYIDALSSMGKGLGYDPTDLYLRELVSQGSIKELGSVVADTYVEGDATGYRYWVRIDTPESRYRSARSSEYVAVLERESRIEAEIAESLVLYRDNEDTKAIEKLLEAILIALEGPIENPEYTAEAILGKAMEYLENLELSLSDFAEGEIGVEVRLSRAKGIFYPPVSGAMIESVYSMNTTSGEIAESSFRGMTDDDGIMYFNMTNPFAIKNGVVKFNVLLDQELINDIEEKAGFDFIQPIKDCIERKSVYYEYHEEPSFDVDSTIIALSHYNINGAAIDNDEYIALFLEYLEESGSSGWVVVNDSSEEIEEIYEIVKDKYPGLETYIIARIGVTDQAMTVTKTFSRTESRLSIFDGESNEEIVIQDSYASGMGTDFASSDDDALRNQTLTTAGLLLEEL